MCFSFTQKLVSFIVTSVLQSWPSPRILTHLPSGLLCWIDHLFWKPLKGKCHEPLNLSRFQRPLLTPRGKRKRKNTHLSEQRDESARKGVPEIGYPQYTSCHMFFGERNWRDKNGPGGVKPRINGSVRHQQTRLWTNKRAVKPLKHPEQGRRKEEACWNIERDAINPSSGFQSIWEGLKSASTGFQDSATMTFPRFW